MLIAILVPGTVVLAARFHIRTDKPHHNDTTEPCRRDYQRYRATCMGEVIAMRPSSLCTKMPFVHAARLKRLSSCCLSAQIVLTAQLQDHGGKVIFL